MLIKFYYSDLTDRCYLTAAEAKYAEEEKLARDNIESEAQLIEKFESIRKEYATECDKLKQKYGKQMSDILTEICTLRSNR